MSTIYSIKSYNKENMARVSGRSLPISFKQAIEICNFLRNKKVSSAKESLQDVIKHRIAIPMNRFNKDVGHKKGISSGRYPEKASNEILSLINSVESNAQFKGLNTSRLVISHIIANKGAKAIHYGRKRRRQAKRTNLEIIVEERADKKKVQKKDMKTPATALKKGDKKE
jgi:large subunit ribosomal protein L22